MIIDTKSLMKPFGNQPCLIAFNLMHLMRNTHLNHTKFCEREAETKSHVPLWSKASNLLDIA